MIRRPPRSTRSDTLFPYPPLFRSAEHPGRAESILAAIGGTEPARDHGEAPILRVHRRDYVDFVKPAHADWKAAGRPGDAAGYRSEEHTSELQSLMRSSYAVFCLKNKK